MGKFVMAMALFCFNFDLEIKNVVEKHEPVFKKNLIKNVNFVLADPPYKVQMNRNDVHAAYVFSLNDMTNMTKMMEDILKKGT